MSYEPASIVAVIVGLGEVLKGLKVPQRFLPVINVLFGIIASFAFSYDGTIAPTMLQGLVIGLSAAGVYDLAVKPIKKVVKKKQ